jgi:hypothetical protein
MLQVSPNTPRFVLHLLYVSVGFVLLTGAYYILQGLIWIGDHHPSWYRFAFLALCSWAIGAFAFYFGKAEKPSEE